MMKEIILVRSLTDSDLGIFAAHRDAARSKQRAININASFASQLVAAPIFDQGGAEFDCICRFGDTTVRSRRHLGKVGKNWRLGGAKLEGAVFAELDSKDFVLIRSVAGNDGSEPVTVTFVSKIRDRVIHAGIAAIVERNLDQSMALVVEGDDAFDAVARYCSTRQGFAEEPAAPPAPAARPAGPVVRDRPKVPRMPVDSGPVRTVGAKPISEKIRGPHILERMLRVAGDLSAPAQLRFMETVEQLASQLRGLLLATGGITRLEKNHPQLWRDVAGRPMGFVDGGLANLSMLGSAPIAARVGGYVVTPGQRGPDRESFYVLKYLIDELYAHDSSGVYTDTFPDIGALRDAARISIEAAGAVRMLSDRSDLRCVLTHGALVNPVSRYTDVMQDGRVRHRFPDFSRKALGELLPEDDPPRHGRERNFISVHLRQLEILSNSDIPVCGVIERESTTCSVIRAVLAGLDDEAIRDLLPVPPAEWKHWFRNAVDPSGDDEMEGQRITDSLLFRCILEPGELLTPVILDRNEMRRAPTAWAAEIFRYPKPRVSYLQVTEWSAPIRLEAFEKDLPAFNRIADIVMHCALLLPRYAFPVGLDIVDKFARIPNWMARPVNTHTAVRVLKQALDSGDTRLFNALRRTLCGSSREWLLRPGPGR
jgi:hypothetical protein